MPENWRDKVKLGEGDITQVRTDAIVNAANNDLLLGAGVAGAIRMKGGSSIQRECDAIGPIAVGEAAITGGGDLPAKHVIHAASMRLGERTSPEALRSSVRNSLRLANENSLHSIAFPAIGTGIAGFPISECARIMLEEIRNHLNSITALERVEIILFDAAALGSFEHVLASLED